MPELVPDEQTSKPLVPAKSIARPGGKSTFSALASGSGAAVFATAILGFFARRNPIHWSLPPIEFLIAGGGLLVLVVRPASSRLSATMRRWSRRRDALAADAFVAAFAALLLLQTAEGWCLPGWTPVLLVLAGVSSVALLGRLVMTSRLRSPNTQIDAATSRFQIALGDSGFAALPGLGDDLLGRVPLADALQSLVAYPREQPLTLGLTGPWGSGKTTILNELAARLRRDGYIVVQFDAWNFREPGRVVDAYFRYLDGALRQWAFLPGLRSIIAKLARGVSSVASDRIGKFTSLVVPESTTGTVTELRADLADALRALGRQVIVIVDDLDRLDEPELTAAFRAIRLIAELKLVHVVAYDRSELARILFPSDPTGRRSRDYIAKVVNIELALPVPARDRQIDLLNYELRGLWDALGPEEARALEAKLRGAVLNAVLRSLSTPREVKRVVAATAWMWDRLHPHVNLLDLFLLNLLQSRHPSVYDTITAHPEWFVHLRWEGDLSVALRREDHEAAAKRYAERLLAEDSDGDSVLTLLGELFPTNVAFKKHRTAISAAESRREHRLFHPDIFWRYFQLGLRPNEIGEVVIEQTFAAIRETPAGTERQQAVTRFLVCGGDEGQMRQVIDQWDIVDDGIRTADDPALTRDIVLGIARALPEIPGNPDELIAPRKAMSYEAMELMGGLPLQADTDSLAVEIAETSDDVEFLGDLVFYARDAELQRRSETFGKHAPDGDALRTILDRRLLERYEAGQGPLTTAKFGELIAAVYRVTPNSLDDYFVRDVETAPKSLLRLLDLAIGMSGGSNTKQYRAFRVDLNSLGEHVDLARLNTAIEKVSLSDWSVTNQAILGVFKNWIAGRGDIDDEPAGSP